MRLRRIGALLALLGFAVTSTVTTLVARPSTAVAGTSCTGKLVVRVVDDRGVTVRYPDVMMPSSASSVDDESARPSDDYNADYATFNRLCTGTYTVSTQEDRGVPGYSWTGKATNGQTTRAKIVAPRPAVIGPKVAGAVGYHFPQFVVFDAKGRNVGRFGGWPQDTCDDWAGDGGGSDLDTFWRTAAGTYTIKMISTSVSPVVPIGATTATVTVKPGQIVEPSFKIQPPGAIEGRINNQLYVSYRHADEHVACRYGIAVATSTTGFSRYTELTETGDYRFNDLPVGKYRITLKPETGEAVRGPERPQVYPGRGKPTQWITVASGSRTTLPAVRLSDIGSSVRASMTIPRSAAGDCEARLLAANGKTYRTKRLAARTGKSFRSFTFQGWVPAGKYKVRMRCELYTWPYSDEYAPFFSDVPVGKDHPVSTFYYDGTKDGTTSRTKAKWVSATVNPAKVSAVKVTLKKRASLSRPKVTGTAKVGKTLTVRLPKNSSKRTYYIAWLRNGKPVYGAPNIRDLSDARTYRLSRADSGKKISAKVWVIERYKAPASKTSPAFKVR